MNKSDISKSFGVDGETVYNQLILIAWGRNWRGRNLSKGNKNLEGNRRKD